MMQNDEFHDFDPYEWMIEMSIQLEKLTKMHNELVEHYSQTMIRLKMQEDQLIELQARYLAGE